MRRFLKKEEACLMIVRHLKRLKRDNNIIKRIIGKLYALPHDYVDDYTINRVMLDVVEHYKLIKDWKEFILTINPDKDKWLTKVSKPWQEALRDELQSKIRLASKDDLAGYISPAWFRNYWKREHGEVISD